MRKEEDGWSERKGWGETKTKEGIKEAGVKEEKKGEGRQRE